MKILSLNIWAGKKRDALLHLLSDVQGGIDVFCFQEMMFGEEAAYTENGARQNIYSEIKSILPDHVDYSYFAPLGSCFEGLATGNVVGQSIFVKKNHPVTDIGGFRTYGKESAIAGDRGITITGNCQWLEVGGAKPTVILNLHGLWQSGSHKLDTPERLDQSQRITEFLATRDGRKVLIGDFNTRPEIKSMDMLRETMRDLIAENGITSTRSSLYGGPITYSDYAFVSADATVAQFMVLADEVSDHLPLLLELD